MRQSVSCYDRLSYGRQWAAVDGIVWNRLRDRVVSNTSCTADNGTEIRGKRENRCLNENFSFVLGRRPKSSAWHIVQARSSRTGYRRIAGHSLMLHRPSSHPLT